VHRLWEIRAFLLYFFVNADLLQLQLYVYDVLDASTSVLDAVFNTADAFQNCCVGCLRCSLFVFEFPFGFKFFLRCIFKARRDTTKLHQSGYLLKQDCC